MAIYEKAKKEEDRVFIPKWEYRALRDIATRVDVLKAVIEAEEAHDKERGFTGTTFIYTDKIKLYLGFDRKKEYTTGIVTEDDLIDAFGYTE